MDGCYDVVHCHAVVTVILSLHSDYKELPFPGLLDMLFTVLFLRHPLDMLKSLYLFKAACTCVCLLCCVFQLPGLGTPLCLMSLYCFPGCRMVE